MRAQASLENLVVLAALFALLAALMPAVGTVKEAGEHALVVRQQAFMLERLVSSTEKALAMGSGTSFTISVFCARDSVLEWREGFAVLKYENEELKRPSGELEYLHLLKGQRVVRVWNDGTVRLEVTN